MALKRMVKASPRARQRSKARISAYEELLAHRRLPGPAQIVIPAARLGSWSMRPIRQGLAALNLSSILIFARHRGGDGPNGAGKTTLFRIMTGQRSRSGTMRVGDLS
jgi:hypothetical protein